MLVPLVGCVYTAAGILAWIRRPANGMGPLLCIGGLVWLAASAVNIAIPAFIAIGSVTQTLPTALAVHALLAYPSGRLRTTPSRVLTVAAYLATTVLQAPLYLFGASWSDPDVLLVADRPDLLAVGQRLQGYAGLVILVATGALLVRRLGRHGSAASTVPAAGVRVRRGRPGGHHLERDPRPDVRHRPRHARDLPALHQHGAAGRLRHRPPGRRLRTHPRSSTSSVHGSGHRTSIASASATPSPVRSGTRR